MKRVIITGGGTGGHIYPAIAAARALKERVPELQIRFIGTKRGLEATLVPQEGFSLSFVHARGLSSHPIKALRAIVSLTAGFLQSLAIMLRERPHLVVGTGGYVSAPVVLAGCVLGIPAVILEQNTVPGKTTKLLSRLARTICVSFEGTKEYFPAEKVHVTGNPVREEILSTTRSEGRARMEISGEMPCLLVTGASQGARSINEGIIDTIARWNDREWMVVHLTGEKNYEEVKKKAEEVLQGARLHYRCISFMKNIADAYAACDLVVARAGATTLAEITARGIPSILVPYPFSAEAHQERNARWLEEKGACRVVLDGEVREKLPDLVGELMEDKDRLREMGEKARAMGKPHAIETIAEVIMEALNNTER